MAVIDSWWARRPTGAGRAALRAYRHLPRSARVHATIRWWSAPFPRIAAFLPTSGRVLEIGCGHGLFSTYAALAGPGRSVVGVDIDADKIALARQAEAQLPGVDLTFRVAESGAVPTGPWDAIVIVDVLYLLDTDHELALLDACAAELAPRGVLVVKETDVVPAWKHRIAKLQEVLATRVLRITAGDALTFTPIAELAAHLADRGLEVSVRRVDEGYPHPHSLLVARSLP